MDGPVELQQRDLRQRLEQVSIADRARLQRRLDGLHRAGDQKAGDGLRRIAAEVDLAQARLLGRAAAVPEIGYPEQLPVSRRRGEIAAAIRDHQVVVVAGETGSGKTTQLPKICLDLGRGIRGTIGHTQPRRIAARSVAERIAEELGVQVGEAVGYAVRFTDRVGEQTLVKVMTDGILLAEIQRDRLLQRYDTLIVDEAHERSLNIDFLLGYLHQLLPRRPDLKLVLTSATIDPQRFAAHFGGAPVIEVSGRTYPVEIRYRPLSVPLSTDDGEDEAAATAATVDTGPGPRPDRAGDPRRRVPARQAGEREEPRDQVQGIIDAVHELYTAGRGDILVFLSGEREIRDTADALAGERLRDTEILPLYSRLSAAEQHRVFSAHPGRRIVLATNVAETSLTVPGIRYVVDPGTARVSRYSHRLKVQRLPIEPISQASARQRAGRCGRVADGICIRLYSDQDYASRPAFTEPEILRTNLASVILQMAALGLGEVSSFGFLDPPDHRQVRDGVQLLSELGALDPGNPDPRSRLTPLGRTLAQLPIDPRLARMLVEADRNGCLSDVLVIAAALSIQDPRERPVEHQAAADAAHARFADPQSDFLGYLNLWEYLTDRQRELSGGRFRRLCAAEYLHYLRVREWQDLHAQLRQVARGLGMTANPRPRTASAMDGQAADGQATGGAGGPTRVELTAAQREQLHRSLLAGLLSHVGLKDPAGGEYLGARSAKFLLWPGSALRRSLPRWVVAAELVETSRLWGRVVARVEPEWIEQLAGHLVRRSYSEPHWERDRGAVMAVEKVTLYGIPLVAGRSVGYGTVDPELARELFIRHALVEGDWRTRHHFFHANRALVEDVEDLEHKVRRRDILVDDETLFAFYDNRIPADVVSARHFDAWWKKARQVTPDLLDYSTSLLVNEDAAAVDERDYPTSWRADGLELPLTYQFEPGTADDGVTVHVPLAVLNRVPADGFEWLVPGMREELVTALIRGLPKALRRLLVPAPDTARAVVTELDPGQGPLPEALSRHLQRRTGQPIPTEAWDLAGLPDHLRVTFAVVGEDGAVRARSKDLEALRRKLKPAMRATVARAGHELERSGLTSWTIGTLPRVVEQQAHGLAVRGFPALVDEGATVTVRVLTDEAEQQRAMWAGTRRLVRLGLPSPVRPAVAGLSNTAKLTLGHNPHGGVPALLEDCLTAALDRLLREAGAPAWDATGFAALLDAVRPRLLGALLDVLHAVELVLAAAADVERRLQATSSLTLLDSLTDARNQLNRLIHKGFVAETGADRLSDLVRYLRALQHRLERLPERPGRDREAMARLEPVVEAYRDLLAGLPPARRDSPDIRQVRWMIEELRVGLFAQQIRTAYPVSDKRVLKFVAELRSPAPVPARD
jgi:ATP-dependent helicase HrpA